MAPWSASVTSARCARVARNYDLLGRLNGKATALIRLYLRSGANALDVREAIVARMNELAPDLPAGRDADIPFDTTPFITASIEEVVKTLVEAMVLVSLVVFIFLQSWRATLIPVLAVPVSDHRHVLRAADARLLDQLAHALRSGAGHRHRGGRCHRGDRERRADHGARSTSPPRVAADGHAASARRADRHRARALRRVRPGGVHGRDDRPLYKQFAITIVVSVVISGIVALTLTPALCAVLLKPDRGASTERAPSGGSTAASIG